MSKLRDNCFAYWKIETGRGFKLPCKGTNCNGRLMDVAGKEQWHADHHVPKAHGGSDFPPNVRPLCLQCHRDKTGQIDVPAIAKGQRQARSVFGIKRSKGFRRPPGAKFDWETGRYKREDV